MFKCEICNREFKREASLGTHISYVHNRKLEKCLICGYESCLGPMKRHINKVHELDYQSYMEQYNPDEATDMSNYIVCKICGSRYSCILSKHLKLKHNLTTDEYQKLYPDADISTQYWQSLMSERNKSEKMRMITSERNKSEKMRQVTINKNKNPEFIAKVKAGLHNSKKLSARTSERNRRMWKDPEYAKRMFDSMTSNKYGKKTTYYSSYFDKEFKLKSNCELRFVKLCEYLKVKTLFYEGLCIRYEINGEEHNYYPDFIVDNKYIVEVKSDEYFNSNEINSSKSEAAIDYCSSNGYKFCWYTDKKNNKITDLEQIVLCRV